MGGLSGQPKQSLRLINWMPDRQPDEGSARRSYNEHRIVRVDVRNSEQAHMLKTMARRSNGSIECVTRSKRGWLLRIAPSFLDSFRAALGGNIDWHVIVQNLQQKLDQQLNLNQRALSKIHAHVHVRRSMLQGNTSIWHTAFHKYEDQVQWMTSLVAQHSDITELLSVGTTYEGFTIYGLKITGTGHSSPFKPQIYLDGCIHAREWISSAVVQFIIGELVDKYSIDPEIARLVDSIEWYFVPVVNVDGYIYSWTTDRMQRKNRQPNLNIQLSEKRSQCMGTDICRNFDAGWGSSQSPGQPWPGASGQPCDEDYMGPQVWSTPEARAVRDFMKNLPHLSAYINFHSFNEAWLNPYGYTLSLPHDFDAHQQLCQEVSAAIMAHGGKAYGCGPAFTTIYQANGIISDWVYDVLKVKYSQAVELRGDDFIVNPDQIKPNGLEIWAAVKVLANVVLSEQGFATSAVSGGTSNSNPPGAMLPLIGTIALLLSCGALVLIGLTMARRWQYQSVETTAASALAQTADFMKARGEEPQRQAHSEQEDGEVATLDVIENAQSL